MPPPTYDIVEARARFSGLLARAGAGEEIVIAKERAPCARIVPPNEAGSREAAPLGHLDLPDDLFDDDDSLAIQRGLPKTS